MGPDRKFSWGNYLGGVLTLVLIGAGVSFVLGFVAAAWTWAFAQGWELFR